MKTFKDKISLVKNGRGCYILDTVKGCSVCEKEKPNGCYGDCYAKNIASRYKFDFSNPIKRDFYKDEKQLMFFDFVDNGHLCDVIKQIKKKEVPFVRIGEMGDPSEDWDHTINVCSAISYAEKPIVIITKHWNTIPDYLLDSIRMIDLCINTSISALDSAEEIEHRLEQYHRLKKYCNSVLRIVSCDFNLDNPEGAIRAEIQEELFENENIIDTVFRPNIKNPLVINGVIKTIKIPFLKSKVLASVYNSKPYLGYCPTCPDMCGVKSNTKNLTQPKKLTILIDRVYHT